jgi:hypothetical protein
VSEILLICTPSKLLAPVDDEAREVARKWKIGALMRMDVAQMRNGAFFRKWWALIQLGYDYWAETCPMREYKGHPVLPNFNRFRKDVTIMAGFYEATWNIKNEMRIEADSLKWSSMSEETFAKLYDATISVLLRMVFNGKNARRWSEGELRQATEEVLRFAA